MKKFIFIINALDIIAGLLRGEKYEGVLYWDKEARSITFKAWNRKAPKHKKHTKICDLDCGWLGESDLHIERHEKFPKSLGLKSIIRLMDRDHEQSTDALELREIIESV